MYRRVNLADVVMAVAGMDPTPNSLLKRSAKSPCWDIEKTWEEFTNRIFAFFREDLPVQAEQVIANFQMSPKGIWNTAGMLSRGGPLSVCDRASWQSFFAHSICLAMAGKMEEAVVRMSYRGQDLFGRSASVAEA